MRWYPPSTIYIYLDLPSTQRIRTHNSYRHNTTPPLQTLVQALYQLTTYTTYTTHTTPLLLRLLDSNTYTFHILHILLSSHAPHLSLTRQLRLTQYLNHVYPPIALHSPQLHIIHPPTSIAITLAPSYSQHTHMHHKQQYTHHSHNNHRIQIGYLADMPKTSK